MWGFIVTLFERLLALFDKNKAEVEEAVEDPKAYLEELNDFLTKVARNDPDIETD